MNVIATAKKGVSKNQYINLNNVLAFQHTRTISAHVHMWFCRDSFNEESCISHEFD